MARLGLGGREVYWVIFENNRAEIELEEEIDRQGLDAPKSENRR